MGVAQHSKKSKPYVVLKEPDSDYSVIVYDMPNSENVIIIKSDAFHEPSEVFVGSNNELKRADFIIIVHAYNQKVIICMELKRGKASNPHIIQQLKGSLCFITYCKKIVQEFWNSDSFLEDYDYRFVSIKNISIAKRPTFLRNQDKESKAIHDRPDRMLKISSPSHLRFKKLITGDR
ncbi:MAG: hypothetical protein AAGD25_41420 [Cyanobacteria bacterium P01_F01_bin.150]